jgi:hypothetical protein
VAAGLIDGFDVKMVWKSLITVFDHFILVKFFNRLRLRPFALHNLLALNAFLHTRHSIPLPLKMPPPTIK